MNKLIYSLAFIFALISCEEQAVPMLEINVPPGNKTVLVEDFTGVSCPNCPEGARIIETLVSIYGKDRVIPIAVHTRFFDNLHATSQYQFKTEEGQIMQDHLGTLFSKPAAAVNRTISQFSSDGGRRFYTTKEQWPIPVEEEINRQSELNLTINHTYSPLNRQVEIEVVFVPVEDIQTTLNLTVLIIESGLIDPQTDISSVVDEYVHDHVLRDIITSPEGDGLGASFEKGKIYRKNFTYTIPEDNTLPWWTAENCEIVAFINESTADSKRVLQAASAHVTE